MGRPASFLRLSGCVAPFCPWCDTRYAWEPGESISIKDIAAKIAQFGNNLVVITGGEPYLQWKKGLSRLEALLIQRGFTLQYETSGKIPIPPESRGFKVCSPKYLEGCWHYKPENNSLADCFKFVVKDDPRRVEKFVKEQSLAENQVWLMPLGTQRDEQLALSSLIWDFCVKKHYNFSPRLHTLFFDNQRGV